MGLVVLVIYVLAMVHDTGLGLEQLQACVYKILPFDVIFMHTPFIGQGL